MNINFITSNSHKLAEAQAKFEPEGIIIEHLEIEYPEIQADTNEEIMKYGINWIVENHITKTSKPFFIEDSGLFVHALNGFPGVYSKYVFKTLGPAGIVQLLSNNIELATRTAHFGACIGYFDPQQSNDVQQPLIFIGKCKGTISTELRGAHGFGFDPIFIPENTENTFAEMSIAHKNEYSHRSRALSSLLEYLKNTQNF